MFLISDSFFINNLGSIIKICSKYSFVLSFSEYNLLIASILVSNKLYILSLVSSKLISFFEIISL